MVIGTKIKNYLHEKGIKQKHVAKKIGCNSKTFNNILNNRVKCDTEMLIRICLVLNENPNIFLN